MIVIYNSIHWAQAAEVGNLWAAAEPAAPSVDTAPAN